MLPTRAKATAAGLWCVREVMANTTLRVPHLGEEAVRIQTTLGSGLVFLKSPPGPTLMFLKIQLPYRYHNELVSRCVVSCCCPMRPEIWIVPNIFVLPAWYSADFECRRQCTSHSQTCGHFSVLLLHTLNAPPLFKWNCL